MASQLVGCMYKQELKKMASQLVGCMYKQNKRKWLVSQLGVCINRIRGIKENGQLVSWVYV